MAYHLTTERTVLLRASTLTFKLTQKTCRFSTSRSHFYPATSEELPKPSSEGRNVQTILANEKKSKVLKKSRKPDSYEAPLLFTPSYLPVPLTLSSTTLPGPEHAESISVKKILNPIMDLIRQLNEVDLPGRYLAIDCEMVGVGKNAESSLGRVSLVNYHGKVILDEFVKPKERVVDYRTPWSGIRKSDMINAKPFDEVQKTVIGLLDGRILIGHALHHDLKVLLLSHPTEHTRDTQIFAYKFALSRTPFISLKRLVKQELGVDIQAGEHSSVQDARATMGVYRLHKNAWERGGSIRTSQIQAPEPLDLWNSDGKLTPTLKKRQLVERLGILDIRAAEHSSVVDAKVTGELPSVRYGGEKSSALVSQMRGPNSKVLSKADSVPTTSKSAQPESVIDIQAGEHSSLVDANATGVHPLDRYDGMRASALISKMRGPNSKASWRMDFEPTLSKPEKVAQRELGNDIQTGEHSSVDAKKIKKAMGVPHGERASGLSSQIRELNSKVLSKTEPTTFKSAQPESGIDIQTGEHSSVVDAEATGVHPSDKYIWTSRRAKALFSKMRGSNLEDWWERDAKTTLSPPKKLVQQELGNDIQTGEYSNMVDAKATDIYRSEKYVRERASRKISQPKPESLWDLVLENELTARKGGEVGKPKLKIRTGEHSNVVQATGTLGSLRNKEMQMPGPRTKEREVAIPVLPELELRTREHSMKIACDSTVDFAHPPIPKIIKFGSSKNRVLE